jgi:hypothetical protein
MLREAPGTGLNPELRPANSGSAQAESSPSRRVPFHNATAMAGNISACDTTIVCISAVKIKFSATKKKGGTFEFFKSPERKRERK